MTITGKSKTEKNTNMKNWYKECDVIMLPTNDKSTIYTFNHNDGKVTLHIGEYDICQPNDKYRVNQHLYFISDDAIKEGEWYMNNRVIFRADDKFDEGNNPNQNNSNKKIIATTDKTLGKIISDKLIDYETNTKELVGELLPQISQSFTEDYVKSNGIDKILVEYKTFVDNSYEPKVDNYNFIIIPPTYDIRHKLINHLSANDIRLDTNTIDILTEFIYIK